MRRTAQEQEFLLRGTSLLHLHLLDLPVLLLPFRPLYFPLWLQQFVVGGSRRAINVQVVTDIRLALLMVFPRLQHLRQLLEVLVPENSMRHS